MKTLFANLGKKHYLLLGGWFLINLLQSLFTNLHSDEAYYWMYSQHLAWGFFDHPPMSALLIYIGDLLIHSEIGVRLLFLVLTTLTMAMIMNELNEQKDLLFMSVFILSFPLVHTHIAGFLAIPDTPMVFFSLLFYLLYRKFAEKPDLKLSLIISFAAAAMIYSKYHAFLVIGFVVLSNLNLLRSKYFWLVAVITLILLVPHILWQIDNHFPTFKYHLSDRSKPIRFKTVHNNITSQLLVAGPLTGILIFYSLFKFSINGDKFRRMMIFSILGFYIFFFIMSFKNRIEAHYTIAVTPLLMFATYPVIAGNPVLKKWFKRLALPVVILMFAARFYLAADFIPNVGAAKIAFYNHKAWTSEVKEMAGGKPVASFNNFAVPATYQFYTGEPAVHLATPAYRFCQYDLWNDEALIEGKPAFAIFPTRVDTTNLITLKNGRKVKIQFIPDFQNLKNVKIEITSGKIMNDTLKFNVLLTNNSIKSVLLNHSSMPEIGMMQNKIEITASSIYGLTRKEALAPEEKLSFVYSIPVSEINKKQPMIIFLQTVDKNRGQMVKTEFQNFTNKQ